MLVVPDSFRIRASPHPTLERPDGEVSRQNYITAAIEGRQAAVQKVNLSLRILLSDPLRDGEFCRPVGGSCRHYDGVTLRLS